MPPTLRDLDGAVKDLSEQINSLRGQVSALESFKNEHLKNADEIAAGIKSQNERIKTLEQIKAYFYATSSVFILIFGITGIGLWQNLFNFREKTLAWLQIPPKLTLLEHKIYDYLNNQRVSFTFNVDGSLVINPN
ncbi:MAG: hypothetical protein KIT16_03850, partial [Rhodospirillaceae bacterium]|nr:hypothetical protein [Rhodospirillaceae bacterium]